MCPLDEDTIWLTLKEIGLLFERDRSVIGRHIRKSYLDEKLEKVKTRAKNALVHAEKPMEFVTSSNSYINKIVVPNNELTD